MSTGVACRKPAGFPGASGCVCRIRRIPLFAWHKVEQWHVNQASCGINQARDEEGVPLKARPNPYEATADTTKPRSPIVFLVRDEATKKGTATPGH